MSWLSAEQSNSSLIVDDQVMLKIFRRVTAGEHPEAEMGRYLTAHGYANSPTLLGEVMRFDKDGERYSLAVAQAFIRNQGDGWTWTLNMFKRAVDDLATHEAAVEARADNVEDYQTFAATIGRQLAAMHLVLARDTDDKAFKPRTATEEDVKRWIERARRLVDKAFDIIASLKTGENESDDTRDRRPDLQQGLADRFDGEPGADRRRWPGDAHPWRLPSRPGAGVERRRLHHRLRGRARPGRSPSAAPR